MDNNNKLFVLLWLLLCGLQAFAQEPDEKQRQQIIEKLIENQEGGADYTDLLDQFDTYLRNPLDLNFCTAEDLQKLPFLKDFQIENMLAHRSKFGYFVSIYELAAVEGLDYETIRLLTAFVTVDGHRIAPQITWKDIQKQGRHTFTWLIQSQLQQTEGQRRRKEHDTAGQQFYQGNQLRSVLRYQFVYKNNISIAFTGEKDAGESFAQGGNKQGFDFNSGHISLADMGRLKRLVLGDFNTSFGQGLTFGSGLAFGKSANVLLVKKNVQGLRPYRSVNENEFLRGVGASFRFRKLETTVFASRKKVDGNVSPDSMSLDENSSFSSLVSSGLHRTASEIFDKHTILQTIVGGQVSYKLKRLRIGFSTVHTSFDQPRKPDGQPYNIYVFSGTNDTKSGLDYAYSYHNISFFGEASKNWNGGWAIINGILLSMSQRLDMVLVYRNYSADFKPVYSNAWGETSQNFNEQGIYTGISAKLGRGLTMNAYIDTYKFPWLKFQVDRPGTGGYDYLAELNFVQGKNLMMYLRFRNEKKYRNTSGNTVNFDNLSENSRWSSRYHIQFKASKSLTLKSRFEYIHYLPQTGEAETGTLFFQDVDIDLFKKVLSLTGRLLIFNIDGYYSRIYTYENDMLYTFSVPAFQNQGIRFYLLAKVKIKRGLSITMKYANTAYQNVETLGSGLDATQSKQGTDLKFQLQWSF
ncbi:MAG: helix-hairpin-helix domain-containing protein [Flavobacteriaceae bacterium]|nr:helix-hairpin-helix domain-containing protein [Flavobacteriaceae bacterium]